MSVKGVPIFDTLRIKTIQITVDERKMVVDGAFQNSKTDKLHGWFHEVGDVWSQETKDKVAELEKLIEADLARLHFGSDSGQQKTGLAIPQGGLGEHLEGDVQSV